MIDVSALFPLPFVCGHRRHIAGGRTGHGNAASDWANAVEIACCWWPGTTSEPASPPTGGGNLASADVTLVIDSAVSVSHQDRFVVDGLEFEVIGLPKDFDHGPYGFQPHRKVLELKWTG